MDFGKAVRLTGVMLLAVMLTLFPVTTWAKPGGQGVTVIQDTVVVQPGGPGGAAQFPPGYSRGKKTGWAKHGAVMPPGLQKNLTEKGKYPRGLKKFR